jgi:hypothetical protein
LLLCLFPVYFFLVAFLTAFFAGAFFAAFLVAIVLFSLFDRIEPATAMLQLSNV